MYNMAGRGFQIYIITNGKLFQYCLFSNNKEKNEKHKGGTISIVYRSATETSNVQQLNETTIGFIGTDKANIVKEIKLVNCYTEQRYNGLKELVLNTGYKLVKVPDDSEMVFIVTNGKITLPPNSEYVFN